MSDSRIKWLLFTTLFVVCAALISASFYFVDDALQRSLNLGFNPQISHALDLSAQNLKTLKTSDPSNESTYRREFDEVEALAGIYSQPELIKGSLLGSLKIYVGLGLTGAAIVSLTTAALLARRISRAYRITFNDLLSHRERVRYLEEMSSWQELAKVLAHEIKNPLTPIEVLVTSLGHSFLTKSPQEFEVQLRQTQAMVGEEIGHLKQTVSRYSDFARLPQAELSEVYLAPVIEDCLQSARLRFTNCRFVVQAEKSASSLRVRLDVSLFKQVLMNIISNGAEANQNRTVNFEVSVSGREELVRVCLSNDGACVSLEIVPRMFDPYVSSKLGRDNMGLGLSIVKKIVIEHGGHIQYVEEGGRPVFVIDLPRPG